MLVLSSAVLGAGCTRSAHFYTDSGTGVHEDGETVPPCPGAGVARCRR